MTTRAKRAKMNFGGRESLLALRPRTIVLDQSDVTEKTIRKQASFSRRLILMAKNMS